MRNSMLFVGAMALSMAVAPFASALSFDQNVTNNAIFGSGNDNGSYTVDRNNGVELGLRGKLRHNGAGAPENTFNSNGDGTYSFDAGVAPTQSAPTAVWSFEWSINSNYDGTSGYNLGDLTYQLCLDTAPGQVVDYSIAFDPINGINPGNSMVFWDHSIGTNATGSGAGVEATDATNYASLIGSNNLAQQSWKAHWFFGGTFDPTVDGTYNIKLEAFDMYGLSVAKSEIQIIVGAGGEPVPEPATMALIGAGAAAVAARRKKRQSA